MVAHRAGRRRLGQAQADLDRWAVAVADRRQRGGEHGRASSPARRACSPLPAAAFPAQLEVERVVARSALVAFEGNRYSVAPGLAGQTVDRPRPPRRAAPGDPLGRRATGRAPPPRARRRRADAAQRASTPQLLEQAVLDAFTTDRPCRRKANRPPGDAALAAAARLRGHDRAGAVVVDLEDYAQIARVAR